MSVTHDVSIPAPPPPSPHEQFEAERRTGIGGSDVHHLFPALEEGDPGSWYGCPRQLAYEKLNFTPDYSFGEETLLMFERGTYMEQAAADKYSQKTGRKVFRSNQLLVSKTYPFMVAHIDRRIKADERGIGVLECKSANEWAFNRMAKEGLPLSYALQLQHYLAVTEAAWGAFAVIQPDSFKFMYFEQDRNADMIGLLVETEQKFWSIIEANELPDRLPNVKDDRCGECLFRKTCRGEQFAQMNARIVRGTDGLKYTQIEDPKFVEIVNQRRELAGTIAKLEELKAATDNELKQNFPANAEAVAVVGVPVKIRWKEQQGATRWDARALDADARTIGRKLAFADWVAEQNPELVAAFPEKNAPSLADKYKNQSAPTRPFVFKDAEANGGNE